MTSDAVMGEHGGKSFAEFKPALADLAVAKLSPITASMSEYQADRASIDAILKDGADRAAAIAEPILKDVYDVVGFVRP